MSNEVTKAVTAYEIIKTIPAKIISGSSTKILNVPVYSLESVPEYYCARYVRLAAKELFDKKYPEADAWKMRNKSTIVANINSNEDLVSLVNKNILKPGMIIGLLNPDTKHKMPKRPYTHMAIYLGKNGVLQFAEQVETITRISDIDDFESYYFQAREVLDVMK